MEQADGVAPAADAGNQQIRQPAFLFQDLTPRFLADDTLKIPHHHWVRMEPRADPNM